MNGRGQRVISTAIITINDFYEGILISTEIKVDKRLIEEIKSRAVYKQINDQVSLISIPGVEILSIHEAHKKYDWVKKYIPSPIGGYFIWAKETVNFPLSTCFLISSPRVVQRLTNLIVLEKGVKVTFRTLCAAELPDLAGHHTDYTKLIMKDNSTLIVDHVHRWGNRDLVSMSLDAEIGQNAVLNYTYRSLESPKKFITMTKGKCYKNASVNIFIAALAENSQIQMREEFSLIEDNSDAIIKLRIVGKDNGDVKAVSKIITYGNNTKGHLDCQGLMIADNTRIDLIPELDSRNKTSLLTHEASIGRISEDILNYLRSRGLSEDEAIDLIVSGFLSM